MAALIIYGGWKRHDKNTNMTKQYNQWKIVNFLPHCLNRNLDLEHHCMLQFLLAPNQVFPIHLFHRLLLCSSKAVSLKDYFLSIIKESDEWDWPDSTTSNKEPRVYQCHGHNARVMIVRYWVWLFSFLVQYTRLDRPTKPSIPLRLMIEYQPWLRLKVFATTGVTTWHPVAPLIDSFFVATHP